MTESVPPRPATLTSRRVVAVQSSGRDFRRNRLVNVGGRHPGLRDILGQVEQRISLVTLGVKDLARARSFYEAVGWSGAHQPDDQVVFFQAGGMVFGLWTALGGHGAPGVEFAHNVRSPREVDALLADAEAAGATIVRPGARAEWGGYTGAFADPDGYVWEVAHNPGWTLADDGSIRIA
jgi:catechol 2,3-dioxygenase-like lactoylglutathione lyase family enzyme